MKSLKIVTFMAASVLIVSIVARGDLASSKHDFIGDAWNAGANRPSPHRLLSERGLLPQQFVRAKHRPLPTTEPCNGRKWVTEEADIASFAIYWRNGELGFLEWIKSFRGVREAAWFAWDDLRPFFLIAGSITCRAVRALWRLIVGKRRPRQASAD